ncbi:MAG: DUF72 domain-containing protein [Acidobacteria bacterium]|jgi:uncharacterized protein YecE (DUF72 family)|nr:DUF72 domain-containing protein [Acidobacteriota bacterium]
MLNEKSRNAVLRLQIHVGCQGWNYDDWTTKADGATVFYPRGTRSNEMLVLYAQIFDTIEVDSTFYAIPASSAVENWYRKTPEHFTFSLKMPQEITHEYGLREPSFPIMEEFCERVLLLKEKLGAVLIQLPPNFEASKENAQALREFLAELPKKIRFAVEFRNREWMIDWTFEELEKNKIALCLVEGSWIPRELMFEAIQKPTANFAYIRFMGERNLTSFNKILRPQDANLQMWTTEIEQLKAKDIFIYFSNFYEGHAPASVNKLKNIFGQKMVEASSLETQNSLF